MKKQQEIVALSQSKPNNPVLWYNNNNLNLNVPDGSFEESKKHKAKDNIQESTVLKMNHDFFPSITSNLFNHNLSPIKSKHDLS